MSSNSEKYNVQTVSGEKTEVVLPLEATYEQFKLIVCQQLNLIPVGLKLIYNNQILNFEDEELLSNTNISPSRVVIAVGKKSVPMSLTFKCGDNEVVVKMPPYRSLMSELLSRGMASNAMVAVHKGKVISSTVPIYQLSELREGDVIYFHTSEAAKGKGAKAAARISDKLIEYGSNVRRMEAQQRQLEEQRKREQENTAKSIAYQKNHFTALKALAYPSHPIAQIPRYLRQIRLFYCVGKDLITVPKRRSIKRLALDAIYCLLQFLDFDDIRCAMRVCSEWFVVLTSNRIWSDIYLRECCIVETDTNPLHALNIKYRKLLELESRPEVKDLYFSLKRCEPQVNLPETGVKELQNEDFVNNIMDEVLAYMILVELYWRCLRRDQLEFRYLMLQFNPFRYTREVQFPPPAIRYKMQTQMREYILQSPSFIYNQQVSIEIYKNSKIVVKQVNSRHEAEHALSVLPMESLSGLKDCCINRHNGGGMFDFSNIKTWVLYKSQTARQQSDVPNSVICHWTARLPNGIICTMGSLLSSTNYPIQRDPMETDEDEIDYFQQQQQQQQQPQLQNDMDDNEESSSLTNEGLLLDMIEDMSRKENRRMIILTISNSNSELMETSGYLKWDGQSRIPGCTTDNSKRWTPYLTCLTWSLLDCDTWIKLVNN